MTRDRTVIVKIDAGAADRHNDLVRLTFKPKLHFHDWQEGTSRLVVFKCDANGHIAGEDIPCQFEPMTRELAWQTDGLSAGTTAHYAIRHTNEPLPEARYRIERKPAHLLISADGALFTRYNFLGVWKPYFWPLNGNHGSVVRGAGGGDHPHHTGLYLAYGGHGEGGSAKSGQIGTNHPMAPVARCCTGDLPESPTVTYTPNLSKTLSMLAEMAMSS